MWPGTEVHRAAHANPRHILINSLSLYVRTPQASAHIALVRIHQMVHPVNGLRVKSGVFLFVFLFISYRFSISFVPRDYSFASSQKKIGGTYQARARFFSLIFLHRSFWCCCAFTRKSKVVFLTVDAGCCSHAGAMHVNSVTRLSITIMKLY